VRLNSRPGNGLLKIVILIALALLNVAVVELLDKPPKVSPSKVQPR